MKDATGLFVVVLTVLMGRVGGIQPSNGYCIGNQCFTVFEDPSDFTTAQHQCREKNGHLMTVRSSVSDDTLPLLLGNFTGRYWIGLHRPTGCPKNGAALRGYKWVTNDSESDFFNWENFNSSCSSPRCVSVSEEDGFKWTQVPCGEQTDGFLCEHSLTNPCKSLVLAPGESVTYRTPMGFEGEDLLSLPQGSTAIKMPSETKYVCFSEQWLKAPWTCEILEGGCEHKCALDSNNDPTCYCEQGLTVNPANKVTCEVATDDPCLQLNCQHVCYQIGDSHLCTCNEGYKLAPDGKSCVDFNDCKDERQCPGENFKCINTPGGFQCVCEDGFKPRGGLCVDVNECESAPCEHECHNWPGTYNCSCSEGYKVDPESPDKCKLHCPDVECPATGFVRLRKIDGKHVYGTQRVSVVKHVNTEEGWQSTLPTEEKLGSFATATQVPTCYPSCTLYRLLADCSSQRHYSVPALPPNITHLYLELNYISEINSTSVRDFEQLLQLDLGNQHVQLVIRNNAFLRQKKLTRFNLLKTLPEGIFSGLSSIIEIDLSSNKLTYLQQDVFPASLRKVDLSKNLLASPDPTTFQSLLFLNIVENQFHCDCNLETFLTWLNMTNVTFLTPVEEFRCKFPASLNNLTLLHYSRIVEPCQEDDERAVQNLKFALFIFSAILIITVILSGIVYTHLRGHIFIIYKKIVSRVLGGPKPPPPQEEGQYDAYLCFSNSDYRWVEAALLKKLDNQFSDKNILRCCFEARDFSPGEDHLSNIRDAICGSRKTVCIVSKEFLKDGCCLEALSLAQGWMPEKLTNVLIMLVVGKVAHYQLMKYNTVRACIQKRKYLVWPEDPQDLEWFYEELVSQILKKTKVKKLSEDKPEPDIQPHNQDSVQLENIRAIAM
eukprot:superscaffoldBa00002148_g13353